MWKRLGIWGALLVACQPRALPPKSFAPQGVRLLAKPTRLDPARAGILVRPASATAELAGTRAVPTDEEQVVSVTAALWASCALLESGTVWCWGETHATSSGDDTNALRQVPLSNVTKLTGAGGRFFALTRSGALYVWGQQRLRVGVDGVSTLPVPVPLGTVLDVAAGRSNFCALERSGRVTCWDNDGNSSVVAELPTARSVAVSTSTACARLEDGQVSCFAKDSAPKLRPGVSEVLELVASDAQHCARHRDGSVTCWPNSDATHFGGDVRRLQATPRAICAFKSAGLPHCTPLLSGEGRDDAVSLPEQVFPESARLSDVSVGAQHACAVLNGRAWCWGSGIFGELGAAVSHLQNPALARIFLGDTAALTHVVDVAVGEHHKCAVTTSGSVRCWGENHWGELGVAAELPAFGVVHATQLTGVERVVVSDSASCALLKGGDLYCWGRQPWRKDLRLCRDEVRWQHEILALDTSTLAPCSATPSLVATGVVQVGLGEDYGCLLNREHEVRCWGNNDSGQLGRGDTTAVATPELVMADDGHPLGTAAELRVFRGHACAIDATGKLWCWGDNGPLVQGRRYNSPPRLTRASPLPALPEVQDVSDRCVLTRAGELRCWGDVFEARRRVSYEPVRIGHCRVAQLTSGPGRCFVDKRGLNCLDWETLTDEGWQSAVFRSEQPSTRLSGSVRDVCSVAPDGKLACFRHADSEPMPNLGTAPSHLAPVGPTAPDCRRDPAPRALPSFPPVAPASVTLSAPGDSLVGGRAANPGVTLSRSQVARVLRLLNQRDNYTNINTCDGDLFDLTFRDARGEAQAEVSVGGCGTLRSEPEIPAQHGRGNVVEFKLTDGLRKICREAGLAVCQDTAP